MIDVIASYSGRGQYDLSCQTRLVKRAEKHYLVHDEYCGEAQLRGGMYRPVVYAVPADQVERVAELVTNAEDWDTSYNAPTRKMSVLAWDILPNLHCLGEQRGWMSEL